MLTSVAEGVLVHQSGLLKNNTTVASGPAGALVVDPGIEGAEMVCLAADLGELGESVAAGFSTHPDWDHVLWHDDLGGAPRYGTARCAELMAEVRADPEWEARVREGLPPEIIDEVPLGPFGRLTGLPPGTTHLPWRGPRARLLEHSGHSEGHVALLLEDQGVLVAGDMLSDLFVPMLDLSAEDPIGDYLAGLGLLESVADDVDVLVPGHGLVCSGEEMRARIDLDVAYVEALRDRRPHDDPRVGSAIEPGWEWVRDVHDAQVAGLARRRSSAD